MKRSRITPLLLLALLCSRTLAARIAIEPAASETKQYSLLEFSLTTDATFDNPYDPTEADLRVEFTTPSGDTRTVPAFYFQPFERKQLPRGDRETEWLYPTGPAVWKARFAPIEPGRHTATAVISRRGVTTRSIAVTFNCTPSNDPGFVRVSKNPQYLAFDNGAPFFAIGQNIAFVTDSFATIEKVKKLAENGANFARVWACSEDWALAIEARRSAWGRSWNWNPPFAAEPDQDGFHSGRLCIKLTGDAGANVKMQPTRPVALRPDTKYRFTGELRTGDDNTITFDLNGPRTITGKRGQWSKFEEEFTTPANQHFLPELTLRLSNKGTAYLRNLSLKESAAGPELLDAADPNRPILGLYNQPDCFMLDQIVHAAEQHGLYLQLVLLTRNHYMHKLKRDTSPDYDAAIEYARRLARYCIARWGYSTHVATWEFFNEMDPGLPTDRFYSELGAFFEQTDTNRHLLATSTWHSPSKDYEHPSLSTADLHHYLRPPDKQLWKDSVAAVQHQWSRTRRAFSCLRPLLFSEFGVTDEKWNRSPLLDKDANYLHLHDALWTSMLTGFASTTCHWYWDDIHRRDLYRLYQPISRFAADIPWTEQYMVLPAEVQCDAPLRAVGLQTRTAAHLWINDSRSTWWTRSIDGISPELVANATISIVGLRPGIYRVEWWDTNKGTRTKEERFEAGRGVLDLAVPDFRHDIACKVIGVDAARDQ